MKQTTPEPGFVQAYRLFSVVRILFWMSIGPILLVFELAANPELPPQQVADSLLLRRLSLPSVAPILAVELALLALLLLPQAPRRLGRWFVPLTLLLGLVPLLIGYYWWPSTNPLQTPYIMFFFVMLVLIAWEYRYRYVLVSVLALTLYQAWLSVPPSGVPWTAEAGWLVLQGAMMLLIGYVTATFVTVQHEQRTALAEAYERQAEVTKRLQRYASTLEDLTISRERNRLARELHDTLAHSLSAVAVQLEAVRALWSTQPDKAMQMLDQADEAARTGLTEARRSLAALRASPLRDLGLGLAVRELAESAAQRAGAALTLSIGEKAGERLADAAEQGIYRIAQEMLENVVRHAQASNLSVTLEETADGMNLVVADDGVGVGLEALRGARDGVQDRYGIRGMRERAALIGGTLEIAGRPGQGTKVALRVPC